MHLWSEMMFGVIAIIKPDPVIQPLVAAHSPSYRLVGVTAIVAVIAIQIRKAVAKVPKAEKESDVVPIKNT